VHRLLLATLGLVATGGGAFPAAAPATASELDPKALARARVIRADVDARYRLVPGRRLAVTEATTTGVVESLTLVSDLFELPRVVPAENGIYFAICSARATCPYPARSASWPAAAFLPRRQALELAVRTFRETSAALVVVALPTAQPVWVVFERDDLLAEVDARAALDQLAADATVVDIPLRGIVDRLTRPRLFVPLAIVPVSLTRETLLAVSLFGPWNGG
jgi:hypothetical protein